MRIVLILLLLANLTLYAYTRLDSGSGEAVLLQDQIQPDKIKLLTSQQVAALGPAKVAALADVCVEWGPFADSERTRALTDIEPLGLGKLLTQKRVEFDGGYWVTAGPFANRAAAETRVTELRKQGARDLAVADAGRGQFAVSFGTFRTEAAAVARAEELAALGIKLAKVQPRGTTITQTLLVVRDPQQPVVARLKDLQTQYPGTDVKVSTCERVT
ncbi:MAG: SPOR domain-containing protein [Betaproteobacteria bacterium]